eukprot:IDg23432t1
MPRVIHRQEGSLWNNATPPACPSLTLLPALRLHSCRIIFAAEPSTVLRSKVVAVVLSDITKMTTVSLK